MHPRCATSSTGVAVRRSHSCRPNCEVEIRKGRVWVMARRNIKPGEELAYNYGKNYVESFIKPIGCRCAKCRPALHAANGDRVKAKMNNGA